MQENENNGLSISVKSFVTAITVIALLMAGTYLLTFLIPGGSYTRVLDEAGNLVIDATADFVPMDGGIAFWKWILSPFLVLGASGNGTLIAVIVFLLVIGGVFTCLDRCGLMKYMLTKVSNRYRGVRYRLMALIVLIFMAMGSMIGSFEECVPWFPLWLPWP